MTCVGIETLETERRDYQNACSWALIIAVLRKRLTELPTGERSDMEAFIQLLEGIDAVNRA